MNGDACSIRCAVCVVCLFTTLCLFGTKHTSFFKKYKSKRNALFLRLNVEIPTMPIMLSTECAIFISKVNKRSFENWKLNWLTWSKAFETTHRRVNHIAQYLENVSKLWIIFRILVYVWGYNYGNLVYTPSCSCCSDSECTSVSSAALMSRKKLKNHNMCRILSQSDRPICFVN